MIEPLNIGSSDNPDFLLFIYFRFSKEKSWRTKSLTIKKKKIMANQMFRIVDKRNGKVIYSQVLSSCNKAEMVERAKMWCSSHSFKNEEEVKKHQIEFSYFTWKNYMHNGYGRMIGRSNYRYGWHCTTVCNLEQNNDMLSIGSLIAGRALDPDTAKKAKGGRYGEMMIDTLGC